MRFTIERIRHNQPNIVHTVDSDFNLMDIPYAKDFCLAFETLFKNNIRFFSSCYIFHNTTEVDYVLMDDSIVKLKISWAKDSTLTYNGYKVYLNNETV